MKYNEIIQLIDARDKKGWEALYILYGKKFYGFAVDKWLFSEDEAWDIVYQTLETIVLKIGEYEIESQSHFDNLIYKIFTNFLRQFYRKKKVKSEQVQLLPLKEMDIYEGIEEDEGWNDSNIKVPFNEEFFNDNETEISENPNLNLLSIALSKLTPLERDLLLLKANDFTYDEIAKMLKIENNQLKVKHHRAKRKLLQILQSEQK
ncbi:MAG: sigma-70 family RNA polymerase sigma factor [Bacteroidia bacterium]|nr:sigma-70 family RNA polymerase sigma factor [Bacteroidia bacterium]